MTFGGVFGAPAGIRMANRHDKILPEIELPEHVAKETLQLLLHTIVFLRAPKQLKVNVDILDCKTDTFTFPYAKLKYDEVTRSIDEKLDKFMQAKEATGDVESSSLTTIGPDLSKGMISLDFYVKKKTGSWFGPKEEKVVFERWILNVLIDSTPRPLGDDTASIIERTRTRETVEEKSRTTVWEIFTKAMADLDHLPKEYNFEIDCTGGGGKAGRRSSSDERTLLGRPQLFTAS